MIVFVVLMIIVGFAAVDAECQNPDTINVALNKPAVLSRQYSHAHPFATADKAVDGNTNQDFYEQSCFQTENDPVNWWYVDLLGVYTINEVKLYNRRSYASCARDIIVLVGDSLSNLTTVANEYGQIDDIHSFVMPPDTKGRYVKIAHAADDYFHLCEVQVFAPAGSPINVALNKPTALSSLHTTDEYEDPTPDKAVDGNTNQSFDGNSCFHTENDPFNWWYVDLQKTYTITSVKLYNRRGYAERAKDITVFVGDHLNYMTSVAHEPAQINDIHSFVMPPCTKGRHVKLLHAANDYFHLCEVQVFALEGESVL